MLNANEIKAIRVERGLSQAALGELLKVSPQIVYLWEKGRRKPNTLNHEHLMNLKRKGRR